MPNARPEETPAAVVSEGEQDRAVKATAHGLAAPARPNATAASPTATLAKTKARPATVAASAMPSSRCAVRTATSPQTRTRRTPPAVVERQIAPSFWPTAGGGRQGDPASRRTSTQTADSNGHGHQRTRRRQRNGDHDAQGSELELRMPGIEMEPPRPGARRPVRSWAACSNQCHAVACRYGSWTTSTVVAVATKATSDSSSRRFRGAGFGSRRPVGWHLAPSPLNVG